MKKKRSGFGEKNDRYERILREATIIGALVLIFLTFWVIIRLSMRSDFVGLTIMSGYFIMVVDVITMTYVIFQVEDNLHFKKALLKSFNDDSAALEILFLGSSLRNTDFESFEPYFRAEEDIKWYARLRKNSNGETKYIIIVTAIVGEEKFALREKAVVDPDYFFEYFKLKKTD